MNLRENKKSLMDSLSITILTTAALLFSLKVFPLTIFLYPIPFVVLGVNHRLSNSLFSLIVSTSLIGLILDIPSGILMLAVFLPLVISLTSLIKEGARPSRVMLISTVVFFISVLVIIGVVSLVEDIDFIDRMESIIQRGFQAQVENLKNSGLNKEDLMTLEDSLSIIEENILVTLPSLFIIISAGITYLNYFISTWILRKEEHRLRYVPVFSEFRLPRNIFFGTVIMFVFSYIFNKLNILNGGGVLRNLIVLLTFIFSIQGLAVLDFLMIERGMKKFGRVLMIIVLVFLLPIGSLMSFVGILDTVLDFRRMKKTNS